MRALLFTLLTLLAGMAHAAPPLQLLVVHDDACGEYTRWRQEVAPGYAATPEGRAAQVLAVAAEGPWPDGLAIASRPRQSPSFILLRGGIEIARMEGYSSPEDFRARLGRMLQASGSAR